MPPVAEPSPTVIDAVGRWTPPVGSMIREPAKLVMIVLPGGSESTTWLAWIIQGWPEQPCAGWRLEPRAGEGRR